MRKTKTRAAMLEIFKNDPKPLSVQELLSDLYQKGITVNKTTVYRELEFLNKQEIIREVVWDDSIVRFEKSDPNCHHHAVCKGCGLVIPVQIDEETLLSSVEKQSSFKLQKHIIEFFGVCTACQ